MIEYGYTRVSTKKQNIERQVRNIKKEYPNAVMITRRVYRYDSRASCMGSSYEDC